MNIDESLDWSLKKAHEPLNCHQTAQRKRIKRQRAILTYLTVHSSVDDGTKSIRAITPPLPSNPLPIPRFKPLVSRRKQPPPLKSSWAELLLLFGFCGVVAWTKRLGICFCNNWQFEIWNCFLCFIPTVT